MLCPQGLSQGRLCSHQVFADRAPASLGSGCFQETGLTLTRQPQPPHPWPRDWGIGVCATFLKTCGILLVISLCLHSPEHFASVFPWNMLSSFQLNMQIFLKVMEHFLYLKNAFPSHLLSLYTCAEAACPLPRQVALHHSRGITALRSHPHGEPQLWTL